VAGVGGRIEWSLRPIAAKRVIGMWQAMHSLPLLPALWWPCSSGCLTSFSWQGMHAWFDFSPSNRVRPLAVWQWLQSSLPDLAQGLMSQEVYV
jgi:hypothetical protein